MAAKPTGMYQIRQIAELLQKQYSIRAIVKLTSVARNTVREYKHRLERTSLSYADLLSLDDDAFGKMVYANNISDENEVNREADLERRIPDLLLELRRTGVTRLLLWEEYKSDFPAGYGYTQFCDHLSRHIRINGAVMHLQHTPAEQLMVDFAGDKLFYADRSTGEVIESEIRKPPTNHRYLIFNKKNYSGIFQLLGSRDFKSVNFVSDILSRISSTHSSGLIPLILQEPINEYMIADLSAPLCEPENI